MPTLTHENSSFYITFRDKGQELQVVPYVESEQEMLCQDCLRVRPFTQAGHEGESRCVCGGEFCGCPACVEDIAVLRTGALATDRVQAVRSWSPEHGADC